MTNILRLIRNPSLVRAEVRVDSQFRLFKLILGKVYKDFNHLLIPSFLISYSDSQLNILHEWAH